MRPSAHSDQPSHRPNLLDRDLEISGERIKTAAVTRALEEFVARREQGRIVELFGALEWDPEYDYNAERSLE